jgi:rhamnogalacturonyl hydrolase YesR
MIRRDLLTGVGYAGLSAAAAATGFESLCLSRADGATRPGSEITDPLVRRALEAALALQRKDWEHGILAQALVELEDWDRVVLFTKAALVLRESDGRLAVVGGGSPTDPAMGGEAYRKAAQRLNDPELIKAVKDLLGWLLKGAPRSADGTLYHLFRRTEMWSDGFNGAPPFLAAMGHYDEALRQVRGYKRRLWNADRKLIAHVAIEDAQGKVTLHQPAEYWGGGMGWAAAGLVRILRALPQSYSEQRAELTAFLKDVVDGCLKYERPDGLFHNDIDRPESFVETNLSQMLAFAIFAAVDRGWLDRSYLAAGERMRKAARAKVDVFGFVQGACGAPHFNQAGVSTEAQAFFLMMEAAAKKHDRAAKHSR